jgi:hypothetical protein
MDDPHAMHPDAIDELLRPGPAPAGPDRLRQAVLLRTTALLRRRRRLRRLALAAALVACYLAGLWTARLGMTSASEEDRFQAAREHSGGQRPKEPAASPRSPGADRKPAGASSDKAPEPLPSDGKVSSALALEWQAIDSPERRAELYRRAGDLYLQENNDVPSALRCYRGALAAGTEKDWTFSPDDNWLLAAAKQERQKETLHAKNGG